MNADVRTSHLELLDALARRVKRFLSVRQVVDEGCDQLAAPSYGIENRSAVDQDQIARGSEVFDDATQSAGRFQVSEDELQAVGRAAKLRFAFHSEPRSDHFDQLRRRDDRRFLIPFPILGDGLRHGQGDDIHLER